MNRTPRAAPALFVVALVAALFALTSARAPVAPGPLCPPGAEDRGRLVMLSTGWCPYCRDARRYLARNAIDYCELDVEKTAAGARLYRDAGALGVPVFLKGERAMNGFAPARLRAFLEASSTPPSG